MNSGAMRIHSKGHFQGGIQVKNEKNRPSLKSLKTDNKPEKSKYKPLWGKVFYIDLPSVTISEKLQKDIKDLGGRVEEFLSKDISYLISNKKEAKFAQTLGRISPVPSPESAYTAETTSPHPSHDGSSFKSPDSVCLSRGKLLVEKAIKDHDFIPSNSILSNALSWGVKILHIDDIRYYIEQKKKELYLLKKSSTSVRDVGKRVGIGTQKARSRLKKPFVKVEDMGQLYRPFYLQLTNMPSINYSIQKPSSPFDVDKPSSIQKQTQVKLRIQTDGDKCGGIPIQLQLKEKKKKGYCECCLQKYEDLETVNHLLSEQHRNFAHSNHYQVVDDIVSKLVFDFVEYERDMPKKKRIKYSVGSLPPITANVLEKSEPKEKLELQHICQKDFRENNVQVIEQSFLYKETKELEHKFVFISECIPYPSSELRGLDEKPTNKCSMLNPAEKDIKQNFTHLPPHKNKQGCILDVSEHKLIINENDLEELKVDHCPCSLQASIQVANFNMDNSASQPKQKSDTLLFPAKDLKEKDHHSVFGHDSGLLVINSSQKHLTIQAKTPSRSPPEEPSECDIKNMDSLPSHKIHRKVKILLGRNKKENLEPNVEVDKKRTEFLITQEENRICSSPVQSLLDLFQTSEEKSEFLGFTSYTENSGVCDVLDIWEEENSNNLLSVFSSSPSTSTFIGF
ncbi:protein DBF4 homolog A isoform X2 [Diceros bicornis minor]|uniref:protein DBF4 homolog A isoform X2 n=1 Tax=Diceros bicornis minor TaxID=77932 RepID=UPI0026EF5892|nr:protein DBF4 homolog A isoform X2 [Diceros bicornis minor]